MTKLNHQDIWRAIDLLAESHGLSTSGLAKKAGLDPTTFNPSKRTTSSGKQRWPSTESLAKVLESTGEDITAFANYVDHGDDEGHDGTINRYPVIALSSLSSSVNNGEFISDETISCAKCDGNTVAVRIDNELVFAPLFIQGDTLFVDPDTSRLRVGDRVLVKQSSEITIGHLEHINGGTYRLKNIITHQTTNITTPIFIGRILSVTFGI